MGVASPVGLVQVGRTCGSAEPEQVKGDAALGAARTGWVGTKGVMGEVLEKESDRQEPEGYSCWASHLSTVK